MLRNKVTPGGHSATGSRIFITSGVLAPCVTVAYMVNF